MGQKVDIFISKCQQQIRQDDPVQRREAITFERMKKGSDLYFASYEILLITSFSAGHHSLCVTLGYPWGMFM